MSWLFLPVVYVTVYFCSKCASLRDMGARGAAESRSEVQKLCVVLKLIFFSASLRLCEIMMHAKAAEYSLEAFCFDLGLDQTLRLCEIRMHAEPRSGVWKLCRVEVNILFCVFEPL